MVEQPQAFFTEEHRVPGDNPFYQPAGGRYMIASLDSVPADAEYGWSYEEASKMGLDSFKNELKDKISKTLKQMKL